MFAAVRSLLKNVLPAGVIAAGKDTCRNVRRTFRPTSWGDMRTLEPRCRSFGYSRGTPVDRYYIERFLDTHRADVRGRVLEIAEPTYTHRFGGANVARAEVLHAVAGNPQATVVGDLQRPETVPQGAFDCLILTQTLQCVFDVATAVATTERALKPGGVALVTTSGIGQISLPDMNSWGEYWRFTSLAVRRLFENVFPPDHVTVRANGNLLAAVALLHGIAHEELTREELEHNDPAYELVITARAVKPGGG